MFCVLLSQIINTFSKNLNASAGKLPNELKNGIEILVRQAVFKVALLPKGCHFVFNDLMYQKVNIKQWTLVYLSIYAHLITSQ